MSASTQAEAAGTESWPSGAIPADIPAARTRRIGGATVLVLVVGVLITGTVTWTAWELNQRTEQRLLHVQTQQAADVLIAAIPSTQTPLTTAAEVAEATGGDPARFVQLMGPQVAGSSNSFRLRCGRWREVTPPNWPTSAIRLIRPGSGRWPHAP